MGMTVLPEHRCELIYLMSIVLMKDIDTNMHGLGLPFMPLEGAKIAKSRFWSVVLLRCGEGAQNTPLDKSSPNAHNPTPPLVVWV